MGCREMCCLGKGVTCGISSIPSYLGEMITADIIFSSRGFGVLMTNKTHINSYQRVLMVFVQMVNKCFCVGMLTQHNAA